jgi:hypothetical protein
MTDRTQVAETRSETIFRHTRDMQRATGCSMQTFSARVVEHYHATVPEHLRDVTFKTGGDVYRDAQTNAQHLARWMNPDEPARMPVDLEESWVAGLAEPYRSDCRRDLAHRYGLLDVPQPTAQVSDLGAVSRLTRELGEALEAIAPALDNGRFGPEDAAVLPNAIKELDDVLAAGHALRVRLVNVQQAAGAE